MKLEEIYKYADRIGVLVFSTIYNNEVHSRVAHFNGFDEEGIYFRTMANKPFGRQLEETGKVTVCGVSDTRILEHLPDGTPVFPTGYSFRIIGEVKKVPAEVIKEKAKFNAELRAAATDIEKYPAMAEGNFVIYKAKGEIFDFDFECKNRDHKILRTRFAFGGATYNPAGVRINDNCIECGTCKEVCSFKAIEEGSPYRVNPNRCDDCGSCMLECPVGTIEESLVL
ncbi:MAG: 4Fe-4S binding protein [Marinifilaceae bacterium]